MLLTDNWSRSGCSLGGRCKAILPDGSQSEAGKMPSGKREALLCRCKLQKWKKYKIGNIHGEWDGSLSTLLLTPTFSKSALCIAACSFVIKPRVRINFHLCGFSWVFFESLFILQHGIWPDFCTKMNVIFPRADANGEMFGLLHYRAPHTPLYFAQELKWQAGGFTQWIEGIAPWS